MTVAFARYVVAWLVIDLRSLGLAVLGAACLAAAGVAIFMHHRSRYEQITAFVALTLLMAIGIVIASNALLPTAVFTVRAAFPLP